MTFWADREVCKASYCPTYGPSRPKGVSTSENFRLETGPIPDHRARANTALRSVFVTRAAGIPTPAIAKVMLFDEIAVAHRFPDAREQIGKMTVAA